MRQPARLASLAIAALLLSSASAAIAAPPCLDEAEARLTTLDVASQNVKSINVIKVIGTPEFGNAIGYDVWVSLNDCEGNLVLNMTKACGVKQAYTKGRCQVAGLSQY